MDFCRNKFDKNDPRAELSYKESELFHNWVSGDRANKKRYDNELINQNLNYGDFFVPLVFIVFYGRMHIEGGWFDEAGEMVNKLSEIADVYDYEHAREEKYHLSVPLLLKCRKLHEALIEIDEGIPIQIKIGAPIHLNESYSLKAQAEIFLGDMEEAKKSLENALEYESAVHGLNLWQSHFLLAQAIFSLQKLEETKNLGIKHEFTKASKTTLKYSRKVVKNSKKVAPARTEALRLLGTCYWLTGKQQKALIWWNKSVKEGERLNARLELSRTYMEIGKRLLEPGSKYKDLNGISAEEYLEKARTMFEDMDLQWDLDELDKIVVHR